MAYFVIAYKRKIHAIERIPRMGTIKAGVIGVGFIGPLHIEAIRRLGNVEVAALAGNKTAPLEKARLLGVSKVYGDYKELLADPEIQVVHICTPNNLHYEMAKAAIEAGKHVVCEKPLSLTVSEARELVHLARENHRANAVHFNVRFYPLIHHAMEMVERGDLGEIFAVNGSYQQDWLFRETDYSWRLEPELSGDSRAIADIGSHWLDSIEFVTGKKVVKVCADFATFYPTRKKPLKPVETYSGKVLEAKDYKDVQIHTEDYATVLLRFDNGAHGSLTVNQVAAGRKNRIYFEIYGSKASISFDSERPNELWIGRRDGNNEIVMKDPSLLYPSAMSIDSYPGGHNEGFADTSKQFMRKFYTYITEKGYEKGEEVQFPTFEAGLREMEMCEAIVESAKQQQWVTVKENNLR